MHIALLPFSEIIQVKFSESLSKNDSLDTTFVSMETIVSIIRWFIGFRFFARNPF